MKIADIASEVYSEIGSPTDFSLGVISYWLRANIGLLNSSINTRFYINPTTLEIEQVDPNSSTATVIEIDSDETAILKMMFIIHYYDVQIRKNMMNYSLRPVVEINSDGHSIRLASQTEIGKNLYMFRKGLMDDLHKWINWYKISRSTPAQVVSDDIFEGVTGNSRPIYRRSFNPYANAPSYSSIT